jgi:nucleotide-binding universal stress UspA family protein
MAIRDILVTLDSSVPGEVRLRLALALASSRKARLTAAYVLPAPRSAAAGGPERAEEIERQFRGELHYRGIEGEWCLLEEGDPTELVESANTVDLTILGQQSSRARADSAGEFAPDAVVVEVGRPILVVPYAGKFEAVGRRPLIAWDGSREAARALGDALPLIEGAEAATVMYIGGSEKQLERAQPALDRVVHHLQRHGIKASGKATRGGDIPTSDLLLSRAADLDADMIVAGAYHHSPIREALLGGVSRELLRHMTVPVLMSH